MDHTCVLNAVFYRIRVLSDADTILSAAQAPEGRFHRGGQKALYLSATPKGCMIATARYTDIKTSKRGIFPLLVSGARVVDLRDDVATDALGIDTTHRAMEWQILRQAGRPSPTWDLADCVRDLGLDGMTYASRTDPTKTHLTLFRWNTPETNASVVVAGEALDPASLN